MILLAVFLVVTFVWANIATAFAIAEGKRADEASRRADEWHEQYEIERDRAQASSLSELRVHRPVAMHAPEPDRTEYAYDPTGLVRESSDE